jgi:hypothetical protein
MSPISDYRKGQDMPPTTTLCFYAYCTRAGFAEKDGKIVCRPHGTILSLASEVKKSTSKPKAKRMNALLLEQCKKLAGPDKEKAREIYLSALRTG